MVSARIDASDAELAHLDTSKELEKNLATLCLTHGLHDLRNILDEKGFEVGLI